MNFEQFIITLDYSDYSKWKGGKSVARVKNDQRADVIMGSDDFISTHYTLEFTDDLIKAYEENNALLGIEKSVKFRELERYRLFCQDIFRDKEHYDAYEDYHYKETSEKILNLEPEDLSIEKGFWLNFSTFIKLFSNNLGEGEAISIYEHFNKEKNLYIIGKFTEL
jgi:hypothetical protein